MTACKFYGYLHITATQQWHLRIRWQDGSYSDDMKARLYRVGSPARWSQQSWEYDYPLTPAAITTVNEICRETNSTIEWSPELVEYAQHQTQLDDYEDSVRLSIERTIREGAPLPPYPTNTINGAMPPFHHQSVSYHWALRSSGILLAHEPGLGKTRSATDSAGGWYREGMIQPMIQEWNPHSHVWDKNPDGLAQGAWRVRGGILVICPKIVMRTWQEEMAKWQNMVCIEIDGQRKKKIELAGTIAHAHVINYESLRLLMELNNEYDAIIVDESHKCANNSQQMQNVLSLSMKAKRKLLLTGTPVSNSLEAVFYQMLICDGGRALGSSKTKFMEEYFNAEPTGNGRTRHVPRRNAVEQVSARMSRCTYFLKKDEVLDLPERTHVPIYLPMTADQQRYYDSLRNEAITYIQDAQVTVEMAATRMMRLAQVCQGFVNTDEGDIKTFTHAKQEALANMLFDTYSGHKMVVWARFTHEIDYLCQMLQHSGVQHLRFDGTVNKQHKDRAKQLWQTDPNYKVFVGQLQMGIGITLHAAESPLPCCNMTFLGMSYSFVDWVQCCDRIHRIGQRYPCTYNYLLTEGGIDDRMYRAIRSKEDTANAVHRQGKDFYLSLLTDDTPHLAMVD